MASDEGGGASRSTEPAHGTSSGTDVSLREYLAQMVMDSRREFRDNVASLERHFDSLQSHQETQFKAAMEGIDKRFDGVNEFRDALSDLSRLMATKDMMSRVEEKFSGLVQANQQRIAAVEKRIDLREGELVGSRLTKANLYTAIAVAIAGVGAFVVLANYLTGH